VTPGTDGDDRRSDGWEEELAEWDEEVSEWEAGEGDDERDEALDGDSDTDDPVDDDPDLEPESASHVPKVVSAGHINWDVTIRRRRAAGAGRRDPDRLTRTVRRAAPRTSQSGSWDSAASRSSTGASAATSRARWRSATLERAGVDPDRSSSTRTSRPR